MHNNSPEQMPQLLHSPAPDVLTREKLEGGRRFVMHTEFNGTPTVMVLLNSFGKLTPFGDANRVRKWVEKGVAATSLKSAKTSETEQPNS